MSQNNTTYVSSLAAAHMTAQIRTKQLAIKSTQDKLNNKIIRKLEEVQDFSGEALIKKISDNISDWLELVKKVNASFAPQVESENVGYPIKHNKTVLQLEMALNFLKKRKLCLIKDLEKNIFYNGLSNDIDQLPVLQAPSNNDFWGNENPSVSTVLLYSVVCSLDVSIKPQDLMGAATFYPFSKENYTIKGISDNPFVFENGIVLFGDYQFGGHRYFSNKFPNLGQRLFSPEDCSSSVCKANFLTENQVKNIYTGALKAAYSDPANEYGFKPVTSSEKQLNYELIEQGDIYLCSNHTAIILEKDNSRNIKTLEFSRNIDVAVDKKLGGGTYFYFLPDNDIKPVYILRRVMPLLKESCSLTELLVKIDNAFYQFYNETQLDKAGDSGIFLKLRYPDY